MVEEPRGPRDVTLIQLVSEQTMQNVVPALAVRPRKLIHLCTPRTAPRSGDIVEAVRQAWQAVETDDQPPLTEMPTVAETAAATRDRINAARGAGLRPVVNFTGGTKLMSIGAYDAARSERVQSVYVDTDRQTLVDGGTGQPLTDVVGSDLSFRPIEKSLAVHVIAAANGCERVTGGRDWKPYAEPRHLLASTEDEESCRRAMRSRDGILGGGGEPRTGAKWLELSEVSFDLPPEVGRLASAAELVRKDGTQYRLARPDARKVRQVAADERRLLEAQRAHRRESEPWWKLERELQGIRKRLARLTDETQLPLNLLSGGWLELALADAATRSGKFRDIRWSARTGGRGWGEEEEQDLLGVQGVQIALFSCKRGGAGAKLASELELIHARARLVGGTFTRRFLCVAKVPLDPSIWRALENRATELGIRLITAEMLREGSVFASA